MRACWIAMLGVVVAVRVASAGVRSGEVTKAAALFEEGRKLIGESKIDAACDKFEASLALDPSLGTRLNLADCRERQGRLVLAYELFKAGLGEAQATNKEGRAKFARQHLDALAARLVKVTIHVAEPALAGLAIKVGRRELPSVRSSEELVVEPGMIAVEATAPDRRPFREQQPGVAGGKLAFDVPALAATFATRVEAPAPAAAPPAGSSLPTVLFGGGGALVAISIGVGLHAKARYDNAVSQNPPDVGATVRSAQREADVATAIAIAGGVAIGVAAVIYLRERRDHVVVVPTGPGGLGVSISGPF